MPPTRTRGRDIGRGPAGEHDDPQARLRASWPRGRPAVAGPAGRAGSMAAAPGSRDAAAPACRRSRPRRGVAPAAGRPPTQCRPPATGSGWTVDRVIRTGPARNDRQVDRPPPTCGTTGLVAGWPTRPAGSPATAAGPTERRWGRRRGGGARHRDEADGRRRRGGGGRRRDRRRRATGSDRWAGVAGARFRGECEIPPSSSAATAIPANRPTRIDRRLRHVGAEGTSTSGPGRPAADRCYHAAPMADFSERVRTRLFPALLTAAGVTLLAGGLLSLHATPVAAGARRSAPDRRPRPSAPTARPAHHAAAARVAAARRRPTPRPTPIGSRPASGSRPSTSTCRSSSGPDGYPLCNVAMYLERPVQPARPGQGDLPLRPRPGRHVPAAPRRALGQNGKRARDDRRGLDERRPALPVRDHRGPARPAGPRRRGRRRDRAALAADLRGAEGHAGQAPGRRRAAVGGAQPTTPTPTRRRSRWTAADRRRGAGPSVAA